MSIWDKYSRRQLVFVIVSITMIAPALSACGSSNGSPIGRGFDGPGVLAVAVVTAPVRVPVMLAEESAAKRRAQQRQQQPVKICHEPDGWPVRCKTQANGTGFQ